MDVKSKHKSTFSTLPVKLLVCIISLLTTRDKAKMQNVSRRLRSVVSETPSLWREFVWPFYHDGDEGCVNRILKVCGRYVKYLSFPHHHATPSKLVQLLEHCSNVTELYLPTTKLTSQQLGTVVKLMTCLQKLDTRKDDDVKQLIELVNVDLKHRYTNPRYLGLVYLCLKELTIRLQQYKREEKLNRVMD